MPSFVLQLRVRAGLYTFVTHILSAWWQAWLTPGTPLRPACPGGRKAGPYATPDAGKDVLRLP